MPSSYLNELRPVSGFEGLYSITRDGRVWSHRRDQWLATLYPRDHMARVHLYAQGKSLKANVATLVERAFPREGISMGMSKMPLSYDFVRAKHGDGWVIKVRGYCGCGAKEEITWNSVNNPEAIKHAFEDHGWDFDPWQRGKCRCPTCVRTKRERRTNTNELLEKKGMAMIGQKVLPAVEAKVATDAAVEIVREPTLVEMRKIIRALEDRFDDVERRYRKDWNDRRISEELNLPMAMITKVRREAFGELKVNDDIQAIRDEINEVIQRVGSIEARLNELAKNCA